MVLSNKKIIGDWGDPFPSRYGYGHYGRKKEPIITGMEEHDKLGKIYGRAVDKYMGEVYKVKREVTDKIFHEVIAYEEKIKELQKSPVKRTGSVKKLERSIKNLRNLMVDIYSEGGTGIPHIGNLTPESIKAYDASDRTIFLDSLKKRYPLTGKYYESCIVNGTNYGLKGHSNNDSRFAVAERLAKEKGLVSRVVSIIAVGGLFIGIFFLSGNLTGNVIGSLDQISSNWIGGALLLTGLIGAFAYFRKR